jgi:phospholipase/carboxylesterase
VTGPDRYVHHWQVGATTDAPTLLLLHGTGGDENDLIPLARMVAPGAALLSVRGNVLEHGAPRFFRRLSEGVFDLEDLARRTADLADFVGEAAAQYEFASESVYALGFSNGANIAASVLLSRPEVLTGAVLIRAMVPFEPERRVDLGGRAVLLSQGRMDPLIPATGSARLATLLEESGADVTVAWQQASHGLVQGDITSVRDWLVARFP